MTADELRAAFANLPSLKPGDDTWQRHRGSLRRHILRGDDPADFLNWSTVVATMFVGTGAAFIPLEFADLTKRYLDVIQEPAIGHPQLYDGWTSGNLIHQAYHLQQWEAATGRKVEQLGRIVEFGGGYGAMALVCRRLGFEGQYIIIDLPEVSLLQRYYLSQVTGLDNIELVSEYTGAGDLFIACCSLSEAPVGIRDLVLKNIKIDSYLILYQDYWNGDNITYFSRLTGKSWTALYYPSHRYLVG